MHKLNNFLFEKAQAQDIGVSTPTSPPDYNPLFRILSVNSIQELFVKILDVAVKILMPIVALYIMYAGLLYVLARGNEAKLKKAHDALLYSLIGAAIVLGAFVLVRVLQGTISALQ